MTKLTKYEVKCIEQALEEGKEIIIRTTHSGKKRILAFKPHALAKGAPKNKNI